jgi:hypothetical protein
MFYKFKKSHRSRKPQFEKPPTEEKPHEPTTGIIQGQRVDSKEELWVAHALDKIGIPYTYQYPVQGGRARGGYIIDFVVHTVPLATMIEPIGNHWHTGELGADDKKRQADLENIMQSTCRIPLVNLWIPDLLNEDTVHQKLIQVLYG